jgi:cytochrome P450
VCRAHRPPPPPCRWAGASGELDPARFNPARWLAPEGAAQGAQLALGAGRRSCVGAALAQAEIRGFLAVLARGHEFELDGACVAWREAPFRVAAADCARLAAPARPAGRGAAA